MTEILVILTNIVMRSDQHREVFLDDPRFFDFWQNQILKNAEIICNKWESDDEDAIDEALNNLEIELSKVFTRKENNND